MYELKEEYQASFKKLKTSYYTKCLGASRQYICYILKGCKCTEIYARAMISVLMGLSLDDTSITGLLNEYFNKIEE